MMNERLKGITKTIEKVGADAVLFTSDAQRLYASNCITSAGAVFITKNGNAYFITDSRYTEVAEKVTTPFGYTVINSAYDYVTSVNELLKKHGVKRLAVEDLSLSLTQYNTFSQGLQCELIFAGTSFDLLREYKTQEDIEQLSIAQKATEKALTETLGVFKVGMTEKQFMAELIYSMYRNGAEDLSFSPICVSGANSSMPHGKATEKPIVDGDMLMVDMGLVMKGYWSDMTRCFVIGHGTDEMYKVYDTVLKAQLAGINAYTPGATGKQVDHAARSIIQASGVEGCYQHGLGHSIGQTHGVISAGLNSDSVFEVGNVITMEPGIYLPGKFGVRIEDILWLSPEGTVNLTSFQKSELFVLK